MALQKLKIGKVPKAFHRWARAHDDLVEYIGQAQGFGGIKVLATDGKLAISFTPQGSVGQAQQSAIPPGYREKTLGVCDTNTNAVTNYVFLVRDP